MYQALYRKWRPRTFDEVVGQAGVTQTLKAQLEFFEQMRNTCLLYTSPSPRD